MKNKNLFWGILLLTIGVLYLFKGFGIIWFNWFSILRLWPLLLILWGISLLPLKGGIKFISSILVIAVAVVFICRSDRYDFNYFSFNRPFHHSYRYIKNYDNDNDYDYDDNDYDDNDYDYDYDEWTKQNFYKTFDSTTEEAELKIEAAAGSYLLEGKTDSLVVINTVGNTLKYNFSERDYKNKKILKLSVKDKHFKKINNRNSVFIKLNEKPVWDLDFESGASEINFDLSNYKTRDIEIDGGASEIKIKLGDKFNKTKVDIDSGASSVTIRIPEDSGCRINSEIVLSSRNFQGFDKIKRGLYKTPGFDQKDNKVYIEIDGAVSSFTILRY